MYRIKTRGNSGSVVAKELINNFDKAKKVFRARISEYYSETIKKFVKQIKQYSKKYYGDNMPKELENLITKVKLTSNDFIEKDNKIYELKRESLVKIIVTITNGKTTNEKVGQVLDKYFEKLVVNVKYDNGKIRNIGIIVEVNLVDMELKSSLSIKPVYNEDEIESLEYGVNYSINYFDSLKKDFIINGYGTIKTDGISLNIKLKMETTTEISISLSNENLELSYLELDEKNDIEKNFALVLTFKEKTLNSMTITYSFKENRNRKYFIVILNPLEEFEIPDITKEDAIDFLDYFIEDEKN